jgi:cytoplasmic iron level regulating protein YaaA (DUF328/UPF0246 family)
MAGAYPPPVVASPAVLVLLPPSEGKTAPAAGPPVDLAALAHPSLTAKRERLLAALVKLAAGPERKALAALGLSPGLAGELARDAALLTAPAGPAASIYTGVLYERLQLPSLPAAAQDRVRIASALWGVVRPDDRIPAYRLSMDARVPRIGPLAAYWRAPLAAALPDEGLIVDLRSGSYAAAWKPKAATVVSVRAFLERDGRRSVISHAVKATRGEVARALLAAPSVPTDADAVAAVATAAGHEVELVAGRGGAWSLDVIERG